MRVTHAIWTVAHRETLCGKPWRLDPEMPVETEWRLVTCKRCRVLADEHEREFAELAAMLERTP